MSSAAHNNDVILPFPAHQVSQRQILLVPQLKHLCMFTNDELAADEDCSQLCDFEASVVLCSGKGSRCCPSAHVMHSPQLLDSTVRALSCLDISIFMHS